MANTIKIRRSGVASKVPTTADILLGELAVNHYDGKLFLKKSTTGSESGGGVSVVEVGAISSLTFNNSGSGAASGTAFNGTTAQTISYNTIGALPTTGGTLTGDITLNTQSDLRFADLDSSNWVAFQAPATVTSNITWTLPGADGGSGQVLSTNGSGTLSWATASATITDDTTTNATRYLLFDDVTSGSALSLGVSSSKLYFNPSSGTLSATVFTSLSDKNHKKDIEQIQDPLTTVSKLDGVNFKWKDTNEQSMGLIAQDVEEILPQVVATNEEGIKSVNYGSLVGLLIEAVKEQQKRIEQLEERLNAQSI